jgi:hypothetical protein
MIYNDRAIKDFRYHPIFIMALHANLQKSAGNELHN